MKKLRKLSLLLVLELGCMGAAMPGIVETEAADIIVNSFVLKTTGAENVDPKPVKVSSTSYSKQRIDIVERVGTHFTAAFIANGTSQVYEAGASVENDITVNVTKGGVTLNLYYTETGSSTVAFIDHSDRLVHYKTYANGSSLGSNVITEMQTEFATMLPAGYEYDSVTDEVGNAVADDLTVAEDRLFTVNSKKVADYATFDVLVQRDSGVESQRVAFDEIATVTSTAKNFSYWAIGEKIVSYEPEYKFSVYSDTVIKEVCGETVEAKPVVTLQRDNIADEGMANIYEVKYEVPASVELIETGMIFGGATLETATSKVVARRITSNNEFAVTSAAEGEHRAYLIYKEAGELKVIYDDGYGVEQLVFSGDSSTQALSVGSANKELTFSKSGTTITSVTNIYSEGDSTLKIGKSNTSGSINLTSETEINKVVVNAKKYGDDSGKISVQAGTSSAISYYPYEHGFTSNYFILGEGDKGIKISTTTGRVLVNYIELYYAGREAQTTTINTLTLPGVTDIYNDFYLPTSFEGKALTWTSANTDAISISGTKAIVTTPETGKLTVDLTATAEGLEGSKTFKVTLCSAKEAAVAALKTISIAETTIEADTTKVNLPSSVGLATISWASDNESVISSKGVVTHPDSTEDYVSVTLTPTATVGKVSVDGDSIKFMVAKKPEVVGTEITATKMSLNSSYSSHSDEKTTTVDGLGMSYLYLMKNSSNGNSIQMNYNSSTDKNTGITTVKRSSLISTTGTEKAIKKITVNINSATADKNKNKAVLSMCTTGAVEHGVYSGADVYKGVDSAVKQEFSFTEEQNYHYFGLIYGGTSGGALYIDSIVIETY